MASEEKTPITLRRFAAPVAGLLFTGIAVAVAVAAGVAYIQRAEARGDSGTVATNVIAAIVVGCLVLATTVVFALVTVFRRGESGERLRSLAVTFPGSLAVMVVQPRVVAAVPDDRRRLRVVRAIAVRGGALTLVRFVGRRPSVVEVLDGPVEVARRERTIGAIAFPELEFRIERSDGSWLLGVIPENIQNRAVPPHASVDALVSEIAHRLSTSPDGTAEDLGDPFR